MNSRDAAYDDAIAMSILGPGSAAMRARLEKARSASGEEGGGDGLVSRHPTCCLKLILFGGCLELTFFLSKIAGK